MNIFIYIVIFCVGGIFGIFLNYWLVRRFRKYDGVIKVIFDEEQEKVTYSLELFDDPNEIMFEKEILFKVDTSGVESDRE